MFSRHGRQCIRRAKRTAILASKLRELDGFCLVVACVTPRCRGERSYLIADLAADRTVGDVLARMRCTPGCKGPWRRLGWQPGQCSMLASARGALPARAGGPRLNRWQNPALR